MAMTREQIRERARLAAVARRAAHPGRAAAESLAWRLAHPDRSRASQRAYKARHPQPWRERIDAWRRMNPDKVRAQKRLWAARHREQERARSRAWGRAHREEVVGKVKAWAAANPDRARAAKARRRAVTRNAPVCDLTNEQWIQIKAEACEQCHYCRAIGQLTIDHKQALSQGGSHTAANIVAACMACNNRKGTKPYEEYLRIVNG